MRPEFQTPAEFLLGATAICFMPVFTHAAAAADTAAAKSTAPVAQAATPVSTAALADAMLKNLSREENRTLARIIRFTPEQLASLRKSLEYLEKMSPEEKQALLKKLDAMRQVPDATSGVAGERLSGPTKPPRNNLLTLFWDSFPAEKTAAEREKFRKMSPRERRIYVGEVITLTRYWA